MPKVQLAGRARQDLQDIRRYSKERFGATVAPTHVNGLRAAVKSLAGRPLAGPVQDEVGADMGKLSYRSHAIYYRLTNALVLVVRILHQAQDAPANLPHR